MRGEFAAWLRVVLAEAEEFRSSKLHTMQSYVQFIQKIPDLPNRLKAQQANMAGDFRTVLQILRAYNINPVSSVTTNKGISLPPRPHVTSTNLDVNPFDPS